MTLPSERIAALMRWGDRAAVRRPSHEEDKVTNTAADSFRKRSASEKVNHLGRLIIDYLNQTLIGRLGDKRPTHHHLGTTSTYHFLEEKQRWL